MTSLLNLHADKISPEPNSGCWLWTGAISHNGYGTVEFKGKTRRAHRVSYQLSCELIPEGLSVLHKCDVRSCVNPDHLFVGTHDENMADRASKGRTPRGETQWRSKLKSRDIVAIRDSKRRGVSTAALVGEYGVQKAAINKICSRKLWSHVQ